MTTHLRRHIEADQLLFPEQLDKALHRQEIYGGSLDTALLELELVDPPTLSRWLHRACGLAPAPPELLRRTGGRPWDAVDVELMRLSWAIPLARDDGRLQVAVHPDLPDDRLKALYRNIVGLEPLVAPECCMEALHAEWLGSVLPQRYAVLSVGYIGSLVRAAKQGTVSTAPPPGQEPSPVDGRAEEGTVTGDEQPERGGRDHATLRYRWDDSNPKALVEDDMGAPPAEDRTEPSEPLPAIPNWRPPTPPSTEPETIIDLPVDAPPSREQTAVGPAPTAPQTAVAGSIDAIEHPRRLPSTPRPPLPDAIITDGPQADGLTPNEPRTRRPSETEIVEIPIDHDPRPRARFTAQGTLIDDDKPAGKFDEADLVRRMAGARAVLQTTRSRDAAIEAVITAAMVISPRVAVFRVRGAELVGFSTPRSRLTDVGGKVVPMDEGTPIADAVAEAQFVGRLEDPDLSLALELADNPPCVLRRIDVLGRPVLVVYIDNPTREFLPAELSELDELCADASAAFEAIVKLRRAKSGGQAAPAPGHDATGPAALGTGPHGSWGMPSDRLRAAYGHDDHVTHDQRDQPAHAPPPAEEDEGVVVRVSLPAEERVPEFDPTTFQDDDDLPRDDADSGPTTAPVAGDAVSTDVAADRPVVVSEPGPIDGEAPNEPRTTEEIAPGLEVARVTDPPPPLPPVDEPEADPAARLTVHSVPPPPPLPPPPVRFHVEDPDDLPPRTEPSTLTGLPPLDDEADLTIAAGRPRPELPFSLGDETDDLDIISLASPIDQPTVRGQIELEAEDWAGPQDDASESLIRRIEQDVAALAAGEGDVFRLAENGDPAYAALAARLPGPLEVLRRDLRALPPPAAHGPLIRAAIGAGPPMVPHLLELLHHPNPDIRFYAAYIFQELRDDRCTEALSELAFDVSGDARVISMRVLETYSRAEQFAAASASVRTRLDSTDRTERLYAARAVGTLRDVEAIERLIDLLASKDRFIQEAAIESLCSITGQQLGLKPHRWKSWYIDNRERHRIEWIIDSLRHKDLPVRQWAGHELSRITGHRIAFSPIADKRARESAVRAWTDWWNAEGKARLGADRARL